MTHIRESSRIKGVYIVELTPFGDTRGRFMETFRKSWFPQRTWQEVQTNRSDSRAGVLRGLHFHYRQVDYWHVVQGQLRAGLVDIRPDSPTFKHTEIVSMGGNEQVGLFIPVGVAHGFVAVTDVTLTYIVDSYYTDGSDEHGIAWNDPEFSLDWGIDAPLLSSRDRQNPCLHTIPVELLPRLNP